MTELPAGATDVLRAPCGCVFATLGDAFLVLPHSLRCEVYRYAVAESKRQGKPLSVQVTD